MLNHELEELQKQKGQLQSKLQSVKADELSLNERVKKIELKLEAKELDEKVKELREAVTKTYLRLWFSTEGASPTSVLVKLQELGFKPTSGQHDFVYDWGRPIKLDELFELGNQVHKELKRMKVLYRLETE
ncbi:MAG: hypothetical protein JSV05_01230 [Candidatus Bathyarchaeota archaeon]|nr:MAG: hypothetical protein JSV05_01230 [Candidatus Bathyarchaeota archaeon]